MKDRTIKKLILCIHVFVLIIFNKSIFKNRYTLKRFSFTFKLRSGFEVKTKTSGPQFFVTNKKRNQGNLYHDFTRNTYNDAFFILFDRMLLFNI